MKKQTTRTATVLTGVTLALSKMPSQSTSNETISDRRIRDHDARRGHRSVIDLSQVPSLLTLIPNMFGSNLTRAEHAQDPDGPVRQTDSDAAIARLSAVKLGYLQDPFIRFLVQRPQLQPPRPPLINIGTYVRSEAIDGLVNGWLEISSLEGKKCQVVSMGAGSDTRFWRINVRGFRSYPLSTVFSVSVCVLT